MKEQSEQLQHRAEAVGVYCRRPGNQKWKSRSRRTYSDGENAAPGIGEEICMQVFAMSRSTLAYIALLTSPAIGQVVTATLSGTVVDPNKAVVPGAGVTLLNADRGSTVSR